MHLFNILKASRFYHSSFYKNTFYFYPLSRTSKVVFSDTIFEILGCRVLLWVVSLPRNGSERNSQSLLQFLLHGTEQNSELFYLLLKGSEGNSDRLLLFLFNETEFRVVFSSTEGFERNSESFCSGEQPEFRGNNHLFRLFCLPRNYFFVGNSPPYACPPPPANRKSSNSWVH
jgi:hypothetical protein